MTQPQILTRSAAHPSPGRGEVSGDYNGPREAAGIVSHVKKLSGPASAEVKTAEEIEDIRKAEKVVVVSNRDVSLDQE